MAYVGTSVQTTLQNPPVCISGGLTIGRGSSALTGNNRSVWQYVSTNLTTDISAAANQPFFTDGWYLGMRPGDLILGCNYTSAGTTAATGVVSWLGAVIAVTTSGASVSTGSVMTSTFS